MSIQQLSIQAELAQAAYSLLSAGMSTPDLVAALRSPRGEFTATQAQQFAAKYSVVLQYSDDKSPQGNGTGLSLTVFKDNTTNQLALAIRGTTDAADWRTGNISIVNGGAAYAQISCSWDVHATQGTQGQVLPFANPPSPNPTARSQSPLRRSLGARLRSAAAIKRLMCDTDRPSSAAIGVMVMPHRL
jgi:hypothetical protein